MKSMRSTIRIGPRLISRAVCLESAFYGIAEGDALIRTGIICRMVWGSV